MIKAENLYFSYTGAAPYILGGVNLELKDGEYVSVVGDNGSGKSTLIRLILKLLKPTSGRIETTAGRIGYVPQRSDAAHSGFPITVREMLDSYRHLLKLKNRDVIDDSLRQVGLSDYSGALMGTLSGGQSQKVMIARALMGDPELLVLDEPSTGVDVHSQKEIYSIIKKLNKEKGMTIVSVEHNLVAAISNSTLIYHLDVGHGHICTPAQFAAEFTGIGLDGREE
ncbi:zinc transport system ATP-binding protein [Sporobacter termitidis DSM 10068]|uniref:Zinc transport system ATP-binding protein n=1 Tax=Sporobacter termitidis DSM 10068 TaxID=1123282 RepID=A0A1M5ZGQ8_9FIRM|nr:metal ABC transporter ATP-binding protein [Sporobacter termitidis]SHI23364.1 zinc transport system ATP-binding protein [Sporobacter termitidis DSM 10068]